MCGIHGEVAYRGSVDLARARRRLDRLAARGPDGFGVAVGDFRGDALALHCNAAPPPGLRANLFLGHRRLSIVDLSSAALQPMATADGDHVLVFNGEIYNAAELRPELEARGHRFTTDHSDTEVLLHAFVEWGERCLDRLLGMFAFVVFCRRERKLFLARDRIGQKPLYYQDSADGFRFSSQLNAIAAEERVRPAVDSDALTQYLLFGYVPDPRSILAGIRKLPPAHCAWLDLESRELTLRPYWDLAPAETTDSVAPLEWRNRVHEALDRAVARRLIADVPIGVFLSGGIDSTLVAKMIAKRHDAGIRAYVAEFAARASERRWSEQAADRYGLDLEVNRIDLDAAPRYREVLDALDEPYDGGSALASFDLFRGAVGRVKVMLTGDGGDEVFAGYERYQRHGRRVHAIERLRALGPARLGLDWIGRGLSGRAKGARAGALAQGHHVLAHLVSDGDVGALSLLREPPAHWRIPFDFAEPLLDRGFPSAVRAAQYLELKTTLPGRMLYKLDRLSMAWSIEGRSPFMDHELIELAFRLPDEMVLGADGGKRVLRDILLEDFDASFVNRRKTGFFNPLGRWFGSEAGPALLGRLADPSAALYEHLDPARVHAAFPEIREGFRGHRARSLWRLVVLAHYLEDGRPQAVSA